MSKRLIVGLSALLCVAAGGALAQAAPNKGGTLRVVVTPEPPMLMQGLNQNGPTSMIAGNIYESLLRYDEKLNPQPSLAKSWEISADQTVYTFKLQRGVKWHDGKPFTADDVVFTLDKFLREVHPRWRPIVTNQVKSIEKLDDHTIRMTLNQPFGPFILSQEVASAPMIPKHIYEGSDFRTNPANAGYKGETLKFLALPYGETWTRWAEAIKQNFEEVGIKLEIVSTDAAGWTQRVSNFDFDLTFNFLYQFGDPAIGVARSYVSTNIVKGNPFGNVGQYSNPEVDRLFAEAAKAPAEKRQDLYTQVQKIMADDLPVLWLLELDFPTVSRCNVKDLVTTAIGINDAAKNVWKQ
jgi:ABC-type transport system substrate-binding protein